MTDRPQPPRFTLPEQPDYAALLPRGLTEPPAVQVLPDTRSHLGIVFDSPDGNRPLRLDLHLPAHGHGLHPVVLYAHGGSFVGGVPGYGPWHTLPARGIAVASVGYRLAAEAAFPAQIEDLHRALRWLVRHADAYALDPDRLAGWGSSAGGFLMTMMAASHRTPALRAVVNHYGPGPLASLAAALRTQGQPAPALSPQERGLLRRFFGFDPETDLKAVTLADPVHASDEGMPPVLIVHGDRDDRVDVSSSAHLHKGLLDAGVHAVLVVLPGQGHAAPVFFGEEEVDRAVGFLRAAWREPG
ncbi:alpha/beta hydrolase fold domain-containing protein [Streptomyces sp. cg28]|uniref:alpha/beta hydrolase fold domain-containing protein n=1 Tax=Streptomyces sp. cg28 TaxID=3403457 RepID=UPI003B2121F4